MTWARTWDAYEEHRLEERHEGSGGVQVVMDDVGDSSWSINTDETESPSGSEWYTVDEDESEDDDGDEDEVDDEEEVDDEGEVDDEDEDIVVLN